MPRRILASLAMVLTLSQMGSARATPDQQRALSTAAVAAAAAWAGVPPEVLGAVAWVESQGRPWALNVQGVAYNPRSHAEAVILVRSVDGRADIGLAQIHYPIWGPVFGLRPEELLDPWINLHVAAMILRHAMDQEPGSWGGVGRYHSARPWRKWWYARSVATVVRALRSPTLGSDRAAPP
jgi:hypothetical protein